MKSWAHVFKDLTRLVLFTTIVITVTYGFSEEKTAGINSTTADHSEFAVLQKDFKTGEEVTKACLSCHNQAGKQIQKNIHWTWNYHNKKTGQLLGKNNLINNFCSNARGNEGMCAQCHISYGAKNFKLPKKQSQIDCLVCHDSTGDYYRLPPTKGSPACSILFAGKKPIDWQASARSVALPERKNCGSCHFYGGGGDNVKHGDLSSVLDNPPLDVDVHMSPDGQNFACTACHVTQSHQWSGSRYQMLAKDEKGVGKPGFRRNATSCESCHGLSPHPKDSVTHLTLNTHVKRVACQSCHIPSFARGGVATRIFWDWRTAGHTKDGKGFLEDEYVQGNGEKRETYWSIKGSFKNGENVVPYYTWFNGENRYTTVDTHFDSNQPVDINHLEGAANDPYSRIWPFKRMETWLMYDKALNNLVYTHLWGDDDESFWGNFNLPKAVARGMRDADIPFSGEVGFIKTYSYWSTTHMVAPKANAVACLECHQVQGRLKNVAGVYLAGGKNSESLDKTAWFIIALSGLAIFYSFIVAGVGKKEGNIMSIHKVMIYSHFERIWHWLQALAILILLFTGFRIHGLHDVMSFEQAVTVHTEVALSLLVLWAFATFWLFTTGNWKHYMPTKQGLWRVVRFYSYGIFKGEKHPYRKAYWRKHNPLQAVAYLSLKIGIFPLVWISGLLYLYLVLGGSCFFGVNFPVGIAWVHTFAAYLILLFLIIHLYMLTIGKGFVTHVKPMVNGFDNVELSEEEKAYLEADEPEHIQKNI